MSSYLEIIKTALLTFPFISLLISAPFILIEYHKYGSISFLKSLIIYSFTLYMICAYFLVILPLPNISDVIKLTTPRMQLIPFSFIKDLITDFSLSAIYVPLYNVLLTIPFGVYLRYFFKCNLKKTIIFTFILTLFFELTQLSGLYFIYPRGYRLFDVDDLILNTIGGFIGYYVAKPFINLLPTIDKINEDAKNLGKKVTGFKRTTSVILDLVIYSSIYLFFSIFIKTKYYFYITIIIYYFIIPIFLNSSTLGQKFLNLKIVDINDKNNIIRLFYRRILFILIYYGFARLILNFSNTFNSTMKGLIIISLILFMIYLYIVSFNKYLFTSKTMYYEKVSKTKLISTIK